MALARRPALAYRCRMNGTTFDALDAAGTLREAGFEDRQAEAPRRRGGRLAGVVRNGRAGLATKADLDTGLAAVRADIRGDLYRALWIQTGAIAGTIVAAAGFVVAAVKLL